MGHDRSNSADEHEFVHPDPVMDAALNWFFQLQAEPDSHDLISIFKAWQTEDPIHAAAFTKVSEAWAVPEADEVARNLAPRMEAAAEVRPSNVVELRRHRRAFVSWMSAAAAVMLVAIGVQQYPALSIRWEADYVTTAGVQREVLLPDGSKAILNTDSAIAVDFEGTKRSVRLLKGEAYFDVVHDPSRSFDVAAAFSQVEVKGTAFLVRRDEEEDAVSLQRGRVEVRTLADPTHAIALEPGQSVTATSSAMSRIQTTDGSVAFAWLKGQIVFHDRSFQSVLRDLERYYGHSVFRTSTEFDDIRVNGRYSLSDPELAIRSLATTVGASVTRLPGGILILR